MDQDVQIKITDRDGKLHEIAAPTDMALNIMEVVRLYELAPEGTIGICGGMAMCASCQCYVLTEHPCAKCKMKKRRCSVKLLMSNPTVVWDVKFKLLPKWKGLKLN